jgi:hypothetical protein
LEDNRSRMPRVSSVEPFSTTMISADVSASRLATASRVSSMTAELLCAGMTKLRLTPASGSGTSGDTITPPLRFVGAG